MLKRETYITQDSRVEALNNRIYDRNIPSNKLPPNMNTRPVSTKYSLMPILDIRKDSVTGLHKYETHNTQTSFNPGTSNGPFSGYVANVNNESRLRNQYFAIQNCDKSTYIPSSNSDMYKVSVGGRNEIQTHNRLFQEYDLGNFNPNKYSIGTNIFSNFTRQQVKDL